LLSNIFLLKGKNVSDLDLLNIYSYPSDITWNEDKQFIQKILYAHNNNGKDQIYQTISEFKAFQENSLQKEQKYTIEDPIPQVINGLNTYTFYINNKMSIGFIFDKEDNPYDYRDICMELLHENLIMDSNFSLEEELEIENFLISLFIGIRRYGDEVIERKPIIEYSSNTNLFIKVFLFGIDEAGKTSLIRRIKTGNYNDNYFMPTRKFNIEYIQENEGLLAFWDMPGQRTFRKKWLLGLQDSNLIIYMIDVANQLRFEEAKKEFWRIINRYELAGIPLLILGNKIDLINQNIDIKQNKALKKEIFSFFEFGKINDRNWKFLFTSVKSNYQINRVSKKIFKLKSSININ